MNQELTNLFAVKPETVLAPMQRLTELTLSNTEKLFALQLEIAQSYVQLGVEQMKALMEVKDAESLQAFVTSQTDIAKNVSEKMIADAKAVADLGAEFNAETQKLTQESLRVMTAGNA